MGEYFIGIDVLFIEYNIFAEDLYMIFMNFGEQKIVNIVPVKIRLLISDKEDSIFGWSGLSMALVKTVGAWQYKLIKGVKLEGTRHAC